LQTYGQKTVGQFVSVPFTSMWFQEQSHILWLNRRGANKTYEDHLFKICNVTCSMLKLQSRKT